MISLHIDADNATQMREQLLGLVAMIQQGDAASAAEGNAPKTTRRSAKDKEPAAAIVAEPSASTAEASPPAEQPKRSVFDDDDAPAAPTLTREALQDTAMAYGQKHGDDALADLVGKHSTTGKFSGIPESAYAAFHADLSA